MEARLAFVETARKLPSLNRGWRTPDPSPTREAAGLPGWRLKLCIEEVWSTQDCSTRGRSTVPTVLTFGTPSPSPTRQHLPCHAAKMCVQVVEDPIPTPRMQSKLRTEEASSTEGSSTSGRSMVPMVWTSRNPSPSPTRQQLLSHAAESCVQVVEEDMPTPRMQSKSRTEEALSTEGSSTRGRSMVPIDWTSRTPSPSPTRQQLSSHAAFSCSPLMAIWLQPLELSFPHSSESRGVEIEAPPKLSEEPRPQRAKRARKAKRKETSLARTTGEHANRKTSVTSNETSLARMTGEKVTTTSSETSAVNMPTVSKGSVGHPFSCGEACKYVMRQNRGCLDGAFCIRCHLCAWKKRGPHKAKGAPSAPTDPPSSQPDAPSTQPEQC